MLYNTRSNKQISKWLAIGVVVILFQIVLGGITRLTGSGLSITEWDLILGTIPPLNKNQWLDVYEKYKQFPQYELINQGMTLSEFKGIYFWEYFHRLWGRLLGLYFFIPIVVFWYQKKIVNDELYKYILLLILIGIQGVIGWIMVKSGLVDMPWVSPLKLTLHLIFATLLYMLVIRLALERMIPQKVKLYEKTLRKYFTLLIFLVILQISLGGMVAGWKASIAYPTWPKMNGEWIPENLFVLKPLWNNFLENKATLQFIHRTLAYIILFFIAFIVFGNKKLFKNIALRDRRWILLIVVLLQALWGVLTLVGSEGAIPIAWGLIHQFTAFVLLVVVVYFHYMIKYR